MNYIYNDKTFTQEQVAEAASVSKLSFDDYMANARKIIAGYCGGR